MKPASEMAESEKNHVINVMEADMFVIDKKAFFE